MHHDQLGHYLEDVLRFVRLYIRCLGLQLLLFLCSLFNLMALIKLMI